MFTRRRARNPCLDSAILPRAPHPLPPLTAIYFTATNDACEQSDAVAVFRALMQCNDTAKCLLILLILHGTGMNE